MDGAHEGVPVLGCYLYKDKEDPNIVNKASVVGWCRTVLRLDSRSFAVRLHSASLYRLPVRDHPHPSVSVSGLIMFLVGMVMLRMAVDPENLSTNK